MAIADKSAETRKKRYIIDNTGSRLILHTSVCPGRRFFAVCISKLTVLLNVYVKQQRLLLDCADAQSDLSLCCSHFKSKIFLRVNL